MTAVRQTKILSLFFLASLLTLIFASQSCAESLSEFRREIVEHQSRPLERIKELKSEIMKVQGLEEGLARQYRIPVSQVINYEMMLSNNIHVYHSIYFLQKQGTSASQFILEEGRVEELAEETPPYSFLLYLDFLEDVENYRNEEDRYKRLIEKSKASIVRNSTEMTEAEKRFRLVNERLTSRNGETLINSWRMREVKAKLEECISLNTLYASTLSLAEKDINDTQGRLDIIIPMLDNIRQNIKFSSEDFAVLNSVVLQKTGELYDTVTLLEKKSDPAVALKEEDTELTSFARFWISNEQQLIRDEILMILELIEKLTSLRSVWRGMQDLIEGNLDLGGQKFILSKTNGYIADINANIALCVDEIQTIRETEQAVNRRFSSDSPLMTHSDEKIRKIFLDNLSARKKRYLSYLAEMGMIRSQYKDLQKETVRITGSHGSENKNDLIWGAVLLGVKEKELWHVGEYPITVGKFFFAVMIFFAGLAVTRFLGYLFRKRASDSLGMSRHSSVIIEKFICYIGGAVSIFLGLWSLHIPLTAFAFLGGALAIAVGFGTQKYTGDIFSGIILLFQKKVRIGDEVIIGEQRGIVEEMTLQNTVVKCQQSNHLIIPNSRVLEGAVLNLTLNNSFTRAEVKVCVAYGTDLDKAMSIMRDILSKDKNVLKSPPYKILLENFGDNAIELTAQFFVDIKENLERDVKSVIRQKISSAFNGANIEMPFPQMDIRIKETAGPAKEK